MYNDSMHIPGLQYEERDRLFQAIIRPSVRNIAYVGGKWYGPTGSVGNRTLVEPPFHCEYGYNIHLGDDVAILPNCQFQDACRIEIGHRTYIGPNVKLYCMSASIVASMRKGSQSHQLSGRDFHVGTGRQVGVTNSR